MIFYETEPERFRFAENNSTHSVNLSVAAAKVPAENVPNADFPERSKDSGIHFQRFPIIKKNEKKRTSGLKIEKSNL